MSRRALHPPIRLTLAILVGMFLVALQASNVSGQTSYTVTITVQGLPANLSTTVYVDYVPNGTISGGQTRSFTFSVSQMSHTITVDLYVPSPAGSAGTRYYEKVTSWAFNSGGSYVFSYTAQYYLTVNTSFSTAKGEGWYDSGSSTRAILDNGEIEESPGIDHIFTGWGADASGTALTSNPILMNGPKNATANWKTRFLLTVKSDPQNVSGLLGSGWYDAGSQATFSAPAISPANADSRLRFDHWSGAYSSRSPSGTVVMDRPKAVEADYLAQYLLRISYEPPNVPHIYNETSWHDANTDVPIGPVLPTIDLSSVERLRFVGWIEDNGQVPGASMNVHMDKPHELTLSYMTQYYVDVRSSYGGVSGSGWYDKGSTAKITVTTTTGYWPFTYTLSDWRVTPSTGKLAFDNGSWTLTVDRPYVVEAVWNFDIFPILILIGGSAVVIVVAVGIIIAYRRRMLRRAPTTLRPQKSEARIRAQTRICSSCGNRMPKNATFCQKCGAPVVVSGGATLEDKVYDYIVKHDGVISMSKASQDLGISVERLKQAAEGLKKKGRLA
jgi:ribosomal protein L40E